MTPVSLRNIQQVIAMDTRISMKKMISRAADQPIVDARHAAMWLARQINYTLSEIGHAFGGRDGATVQNAIDSVERRIETDPELVAWLHTDDFVVTEREPPDARRPRSGGPVRPLTNATRPGRRICKFCVIYLCG
jgi:hypothetical protein